MAESGDGELRDALRDIGCRVDAVRPEPLRRPVQRAEKRLGGDGGVAREQGAPANARCNQIPYATLVAIAFGDDRAPQSIGQRIDFEVRCRSLDLRDQAEDVFDRQSAQAVGERPAVGAGGLERRQQPIKRSVLAEEQELVLACEVVIEITGREIGGYGDVAHAGGGEAAAAENLPGGAQDGHPPRFGTPF
jgi:hypothetical protein